MLFNWPRELSAPLFPAISISSTVWLSTPEMRLSCRSNLLCDGVIADALVEVLSPAPLRPCTLPSGADATLLKDSLRSVTAASSSRLICEDIKFIKSLCQTLKVVEGGRSLLPRELVCKLIFRPSLLATTN